MTAKETMESRRNRAIIELAKEIKAPDEFQASLSGVALLGLQMLADVATAQERIAEAQERQAAIAEVNFREAVEAAVADHIAAVEANAVEKYKSEQAPKRRTISR